MFTAEMISLYGDLYYEKVRIIEPEDYEKLGITPHLQGQTCVFIADKKIVQVHHYNVNLIKLDKQQRTSEYPVEMLIILNEMKYANSYIIPVEDWDKQGIVTYFHEHPDMSGQIAWSNSEGTFISLNYNVLKIENPEPKKPLQSQIAPSKQRLRPNIINSNK